MLPSLWSYWTLQFLCCLGCCGMWSMVTKRQILGPTAVHDPSSVPLDLEVSVHVSRSVFATPWTAARQASLSITNSQSLLKLLSIESVMPSNHLILCHPLLLLPSILPSIRVFSNESVLCIRWPKYCSFSK